MSYLAFGLSLVIAALGALGIVSPARLLAFVRHVQTPEGLYVAAALRLALGVALILVASTSRAPNPVRIVGVLAVVAALATPLIGLERFGMLVDWWSGEGSLFVRVWAMIPFALGLYVAWAVAPQISR
jgi:hypothetical protein